MFVWLPNEMVRSVSALCVCVALKLENVLAEPTEVENRSGLFKFLELLRAELNCTKLRDVMEEHFTVCVVPFSASH